MNAVLVIAAQEIRDGFRNRWVIALTLMLAGFALSLTFLGRAPGGSIGASPLLVTVVSLSSLSIFLLPLIGLMLSYDSIIGEIERGTMLLLLSYPVTRTHVMAGKFLGHMTILGFATIVGYGVAGAVSFVRGDGIEANAMMAFFNMTMTSILLGGAFLGLGYLISASVRERGTAAGVAIGVWLVFVLVYDMALLAALVNFGGSLGQGLFQILLLANPTDVYRLFNLGGFDNVQALSGSVGMMADVKLPVWTMIVVLLAWVALPLGFASYLFNRKDI